MVGGLNPFQNNMFYSQLGSCHFPQGDGGCKSKWNHQPARDCLFYGRVSVAC